MTTPVVRALIALALPLSLAACGQDESAPAAGAEESAPQQPEIVDGAQTCEDETGDGHEVDLASATYARGDDGAATITFETVDPLPTKEGSSVRLTVFAAADVSNVWHYQLETMSGEQTTFAIATPAGDWVEVDGTFTVDGTTIEGVFPAEAVTKAEAPDSFSWTARAAYFSDAPMDEDACSLGATDEDAGSLDNHLAYEG